MNTLLENILFFVILFIFSLIASYDSDKNKINIIECIIFWIIFIAIFYIPLFIIFIIINAGGHLMI